jgi:hypothetical protein
MPTPSTTRTDHLKTLTANLRPTHLPSTTARLTLFPTTRRKLTTNDSVSETPNQIAKSTAPMMRILIAMQTQMLTMNATLTPALTATLTYSH